MQSSPFKLLENITYKINHQILVMAGMYPGEFEIWVRASLLDSNHPDKLIEVGVHWPFQMKNFDTDQDFLSWIAARLQDFERHESREWFRYRGVPVQPPHARSLEE